MENGSSKSGGHGRAVKRALAILACCALFSLLGCGSSGPAKLTIKPAEAGQGHEEGFARSYFTRTNDGQYDILLLEDGIKPIRSNSSGPLLASPATPVSQAVYVRVLWKPLRGAKPDTPSATNSVIDWYVRSSDAEDERRHYRGAGFVTIYDDGETARFIIRNARVDRFDGSGQQQDSIGASTLTGDFVAVHNDGMVNSTIESLRREASKNQPSQASAHEGPPPRGPNGP
ncbi:MAG TPA: hypothetical protein VH518_21590 [Tepidisphaeraceae bacterium]